MSAGDRAVVESPRTLRKAKIRERATTLTGDALLMQYGGVKAIDGVSITVTRGEILGLIGPNGAGKSTLVNVLTNVVRATRGAISIDGHDVSRLSATKLVQRGVVRTFQNPRLFGRLSVLENVMVAALGRGVGARDARELAAEILEDMELSDLARLEASQLSYGQERRVSIGRAIASAPDFLLLDEPAAGLTGSETADLTQTIAGIRDRYGCAVVVIEHDMQLIMGLCDRIHVLDHGQTLMTGSPSEVRNDPRVIEAYLGSGGEDHA